MNPSIYLGLIMLLSLPIAPLAQTTTQTLNLQSGWNAIWLELTPTNTAMERVFAGLPVESVWTFRTRASSIEFIQNPDEPVWNRDRWLSWVPTNRIEAMHNNLFHVFGHHAYLVRLTNAATLTLAGRPSIRPLRWTPSAYNLRGFPVDPAVSIRFQDFFQPSPAHYDGVSGQLQKVYRLNGTGRWTLVGSMETVQPGVAYWVFAGSASAFTAPMEVRIDMGEGLDYGASIDEVSVLLVNRSAIAREVLLELPVDFEVLSWGERNARGKVEWQPLAGSLNQYLPAHAELRLRLAVRRGDLTIGSHATILQFTDGLGVRHRAPVQVEKSLPIATPAGSSSNAYAGLWMGVASIDRVNEPLHPQDAQQPRPTGDAFDLRLLLHVDGSGQVRLLKEVTQLWKNGTFKADPSGHRVVDEPGRFVLVTDPSRFGQFTGASLRDGEPVGRRLSAIGYDFQDAARLNYLILEGAFGEANTIRGTLELPPDHPTNPFLHRYHPDHDNVDDLDPRGVNFKEEAFRITRLISLAFSPANPFGPEVADYGHRVVGGAYLETITGLHRSELRCSGTFRLTRVSGIHDLNR